MKVFNPLDQCSQHFKYIDLIHCGKTQQKTQLENMPIDPRTIQAIEEISLTILDPVVEKFGEIKLTYGFCSNELLKHIKKNPSPSIAPQLDQHAGYELNSRNTPICKRLGFACDFYALNTDSLTLAKWISTDIRFDRLYYYGQDKPIHVSIAPDMSEAITLLKIHPSGKKVPRNMKKADFLQLLY